MNRGLWSKGIRETWLLTLLCGAGTMLFEALVSYFFWSYQEQFQQEMVEMEFVRKIVEGLVGAEMGEAVGFGALTSLAWVHPMFLSILFAHAITSCTRMPAGEIDRGTIDVLFAMPLSRWSIYVTESGIVLSSGAFVILMGLAGSRIGHIWVPADSHSASGPLALVLLNLLVLYTTVAAFTLMVSALSERRGRAVGIGFGVLLVHLIWNFLGQYWSFADRLSFLSVLHFFKPLPILSEGIAPVGNVLVLFVATMTLWVIGAVIFMRRDIHTV